MKRNWKLAGAALLIAIAVPVTAYAADNLNGKSQEDKKASLVDAQKTTLIGKEGEKPNPNKVNKLKLDLQTIASTKLGLDQAAFNQALKAGKSLADITKEKGMGLQPLIDELTKEISDEILANLDTKDLSDQEKANVNKKAAMEAERLFTEPLNKESRKQESNNWNLAAALELIGIDKAAFAEQVHQGKSFVDIAKDHGITHQQLVDALMSDVNTKIDEVKANGSITQEQADQKKQAVLKEVEYFVDHTQELFKKKENDAIAQGKDGKLNPDKGIKLDVQQIAASKLGLDQAALQQVIKDGKSFADIAQDHGISRQTLIDSLMSDFTNKIDDVKAKGEITQAQVDQKKQAVLKEVEEFVDHTQTMFEMKEKK